MRSKCHFLILGIVYIFTTITIYSCKEEDDSCSGIPSDGVKKITLKLCDSIEMSYLDYSYGFKPVDVINFGPPSCSTALIDSTGLVFSVGIFDSDLEIEGLLKSRRRAIKINKSASFIADPKESVVNGRKFYSFNGFKEFDNQKVQTFIENIHPINGDFYLNIYFMVKGGEALNSADIKKVNCIMQGLKVDKIKTTTRLKRRVPLR